MQHVSTSPGYYTKDAWPGADPHWGATAASLPVVAGTVLISELRAGKIPHSRARDRHRLPPLPRLRLSRSAYRRHRRLAPCPPRGHPPPHRPGLDLSNVQMTPVCRMLVEAAQTYGMIVRDQTGHATSFYFEDPTPAGPNPYVGPAGLFQGKWPHEFLKNFPWDHLQLLKMHLRTLPNN